MEHSIHHKRPHAEFHFLFDGTHTDSATIYGNVVTTFSRLNVSAFNSTLKVGSKPFIEVYVNSTNLLPVFITSISVAGDSDISAVDSSIHLPLRVVDTLINAYFNMFELHVAPRDTIDSTSCTITVITEWGNDQLDTEVYSQSFQFVPPEPGECLTANDLRIDDFTPFGYSSAKKISLYNPQPVPVDITNAYIDSGYLPPWTSFLHFDSTQFPIVVPPHDSSFVSVTLTVPADSAQQFEEYGENLQAYIDYSLSSLDSDGIACPYSSSSIELLPFILLSDTTAIPLFTSASTPIYFAFDPEGLLGAEGQFVRFINNGPNDVTVTSRTLFPDSIGFSTPYWGYSSDSVLQSNETFTACVEWNPYLSYSFGDTGEYIFLHFSGDSDSRQIPIVVYELGVLEKPAASIQCSIIPNPASGSSLVNLSGFTRASIRISDVLGREVKPSVDVLGPNCSMRLSLDNLPSGSYFISVQGVDSGGQNFLQSQPIVVLP